MTANNILLLSMPRSGQHFLARALQYYITKLNIKNHYCVYYNLCNNIPCKCNIPENTKIIFQKNHDFDLNIEANIPNVKYIYLYRDSIINCIEANYRLRYLIKMNQPNAREHVSNDSLDLTSNIIIEYNDTKFKEFKEYFKNLASKILKIKRKWLNTNDVTIVIYEELINNFEYNLTRILNDINLTVIPELIQETKKYCNPQLVNQKRFTTEQINILMNIIDSEENRIENN